MTTTTPQSAEPSERELLRREKRRTRGRAILRVILIPVGLSLVYYLLIAPPSYVSSMEFTIQGTRQEPTDVLGNLGIAASSGTPSDTRMVVDYIRSPALVRQLRQHYGFTQAYEGFSLDPTARLPADATIERAVAFWRDRLKLDYDATSNIVQVSVSAYRPVDAKRLADGVLAGASTMIDLVDRDAQSTAVKFATAQLEDQKHIYLDVRHRVQAVRGSASMTLDQQGAQAVTAITSIDNQLAQLRVQAATAAATFQPNSAQSRAVAEQISALEEARDQAIRRAQEGPGAGPAASDLRARTALLDYEFAQKSYYAALQAYQSAVNRTNGDHRYVVAFIPPEVPERSNYISRLGNVLAIAIASAILIGTGMLAYSVVKDHMQ